MSIQSSINQAINLGGLLYTQTGGYKDSADAAKKLYKLDPTEENLTIATMASEMADIAQGFQGISDKMHKTVPYDTNKAKDANQKAADRVNAMSEQKESARRYMMLLKEDKE